MSVAAPEIRWLPPRPFATILPKPGGLWSARVPTLPVSSSSFPPDPSTTDVTSADVSGTDAGAADTGAAGASESPAPSGMVRHRTERDSLGRVWRFVYDPAAQDPMLPGGMVRIRCTTGTGRATLVVRADWLEWPRQQLLNELQASLQLQRGGTASAQPSTDGGASNDRRVARRRLVRLATGVAWNCVYDPSLPAQPGDEARVRVRCTAGRDRLELVLDPAWHRLGDRQLAALIVEALDARRR